MTSTTRLAALIGTFGVVVLALLTEGFAEEDPQACAALEDSLERLRCFDALFPAHEEGSPPAREEDAGAASGDDPEGEGRAKWVVTEDSSPLDDSPEVNAYLLPQEEMTSGVGEPSGALILTCREDTTSVIIMTGRYMMEDRIPVTLRVGSEPAYTEHWSISGSRKSVGLWSGSEAIPFIQELPNGAMLFVRVEESDRTELTFDLANVQDVADKVAKACNWPSDE